MSNVIGLCQNEFWAVLVLNEYSTSKDGRILLSSHCIAASEVEFWLRGLESDIAKIRKELGKHPGLLTKAGIGHV